MFSAAALLAVIAPSFVAASPAPISEARGWPWPFPTCGPFAQLSCHNTTVVKDLCCFNYPGGHFLSTQFWDYYPATGPDDVFTLHGLWSDHCDGSYDQFCSPSTELTNITQILQAAGKQSTLDWMNKYWLNNDGTNEAFWEHEYNKHGTCMNTLDASCFVGQGPNANAIAFIERAIAIYKTYPTYDFLAHRGIFPTTHKNYTLAEITNALTEATGFAPDVNCDSHNVFTEVWYHGYIQGSVADGPYVHGPADGPSTCPETGIRYLPKGTNPLA